MPPKLEEMHFDYNGEWEPDHYGPEPQRGSRHSCISHHIKKA